MTKNTVLRAAMATLLLIGSTTFAFAQHDEHGNGGRPQAAPQQRQTSRSQQTYGGAYHGGVQYNGPTNGGVHHSGVPQHSGQVRAGFGQSRAGTWQTEHQSWSQRGGYNGYRIPDRRFGQYFGHDHFFRIGGLPLVFIGGQPRFQYDGYWFTFMDPWPQDWAPDWYESDDAYIDYNGDGYYLYNRRHPEFPIALTVTF